MRGYTPAMTLILGVLALPFFIWSWLRHDVDEDAMATLSIVGWIIVVGAVTGAWFLLA